MMKDFVSRVTLDCAGSTNISSLMVYETSLKLRDVVLGDELVLLNDYYVVFLKSDAPVPDAESLLLVEDLSLADVVVYDSVAGGLAMGYKLRISPDTETIPADEMSRMIFTPF